jgi:hypothetical protein
VGAKVDQHLLVVVEEVRRDGHWVQRTDGGTLPRSTEKWKANGCGGGRWGGR